MEGGPDRRIKLDRSPGVDEVIFHINGYQSFCINHKSNWPCTPLLFNLHLHCNNCKSLHGSQSCFTVPLLKKTVDAINGKGCLKQGQY